MSHYIIIYTTIPPPPIHICTEISLTNQQEDRMLDCSAHIFHAFLLTCGLLTQHLKALRNVLGCGSTVCMATDHSQW